jgi:hypothetical protein
MDFLQSSYDRVLLVLAGALMLAAALYAVLGFNSLPTDYPMPATIATGAAHESSSKVLQLRAEADKLSSPSSATWAADERSLFVSRIYLLGDDKLIDILDSDVQLSPGIPNAWIIQHQLDYTDPRLAAQDPDADGFTNLEEFGAGTNPRDAASKPPLWSKLRVKSFEKIPFRIKFMGAPSHRSGEPFEPETEFSINTLDYSSPTQFLRLGGKIAGTELQIVKAESKTATNAVGTVVDVSELTVKDSSTGDEIVLVTDQEVDSPYSYALLANNITGEEIRVEKGKSFPLGPEGTSYKLIDVTEQGALISPVDSDGERLTVPPAETSETPVPEPPL